MRIQLGEEYIDLERVGYIGKQKNTSKASFENAFMDVTQEFEYEFAGHIRSYKVSQLGPLHEKREDWEARSEKMYHEVKAIRDDMVAKWMQVKGKYYDTEVKI